MKKSLNNYFDFLSSATKSRRILYFCFCAALSLYFIIMLQGINFLTHERFNYLIFAASVLLIPLGLIAWSKWFCDRNIVIYSQMKRLDWKTFLIVFAACMAALMVFYYISFPGSHSQDTMDQWKQVRAWQFDDWHPYFHTLLVWFFSFFGKRYWIGVFLQNAFLAAALAYLVTTLKAWGFPRWAGVISCVLALVAPPTWAIMQYLWKDTAFAVAMVFFVVHCINIYLSEGKWLGEKKHIAYFVCSFTCVSLMRHNGIFVTLPVLAMLFFLYAKEWKKILAISLVCLGVLFFFKVPMVKILNVEKDEKQFFSESIGVPMTMLGAAMKTNPDNMPQQAYELLSDIVPVEEWKERAFVGDWNSVKFFYFDQQKTVLGNTEPTIFLRLWIETAMRNKRVSLLSALRLTDFVWNPFSQHNVQVAFSFALNGVENAPALSQQILQVYSGIMNVFHIRIFFWNVGFQMVLLLLAAWLNVAKKGTKVFFLTAPILAYNFGTMLLLAGSDYRFFYFNILIYFPICIVLFARKKQAQE